MKLGSDLSAIVTGGASGLGEAAARMLAAEGVKVAIFDLAKDAGEKVASEINGVFCKCDVSSEESVDEAIAKARDANGQERILVNCAGIVVGQKTASRDRKTGAARAHSIDAYRKVLGINLIGSFMMASKCATGMMSGDPVTDDGGRGVIISTSSVAAEDGQIGQVAYAASKGGIASMSLPMARDLAKEGIRVLSILPGLFQTPMFDGLTEPVKEALAAGTPFPSRLGSTSEFAQLVKHICENDMLNGTNIRLDGAVRLSYK